jgi:hypothetical protein
MAVKPEDAHRTDMCQNYHKYSSMVNANNQAGLGRLGRKISPYRIYLKSGNLGGQRESSRAAGSAHLFAQG